MVLAVVPREVVVREEPFDGKQQEADEGWSSGKAVHPFSKA